MGETSDVADFGDEADAVTNDTPRKAWSASTTGAQRQSGVSVRSWSVRRAATGTPKGSFYHHFKDKEDFALQVVDQYMGHVHAGLDLCLGDTGGPPLERVRRFFELTRQNYRKEGYMGCLLGGLGQELSGVSEVFRRKIEGCFSDIAKRIAVCLDGRTAIAAAPRAQSRYFTRTTSLRFSL